MAEHAAAATSVARPYVDGAAQAACSSAPPPSSGTLTLSINDENALLLPSKLSSSRLSTVAFDHQNNPRLIGRYLRPEVAHWEEAFVITSQNVAFKGLLETCAPRIHTITRSRPAPATPAVSTHCEYQVHTTPGLARNIANADRLNLDVFIVLGVEAEVPMARCQGDFVKHAVGDAAHHVRLRTYYDPEDPILAKLSLSGLAVLTREQQAPGDGRLLGLLFF